MTIEVVPAVAPDEHIPGPSQGQWSYQDYALLADDGHHYEIIDGVLYMAPAPTTGHQSSAARFVYHLLAHVEFPGHGRVYPSPIDVELTPYRVVQSDVVVVLTVNLAIVTEYGIHGSPDLVIEIASPGTAGYDRREKQNLYAQSGIKEYWIADPAARTVEVLSLEQDVYRTLGVFRGQATLPSGILPLIPVPVAQFFV